MKVDVDAEVSTDASLHSRSSSVDSSTALSSQQQHQSTPTPTPSDDLSSAGVSANKDGQHTSSMDADKSTMWLGTEDGWSVYHPALCVRAVVFTADRLECDTSVRS